jgi:hypothetical protein
MPASRIFKTTVISIAAVLFALNASFAFDDGFGPAKKIQSSHFTVYYSPQIDTTTLAQRLNIGPADEILAGKTSKRTNASSGQLAEMLDTLFTRVCDILDMQLYSYTGNIKVCQDYNQLSQIYRNIFGHDLGNRKSFYVNELNTVYISADSFQRGILGHEIAHAVISHYFVVLPSVKIQEVLAGYVEYQLRKSQ